MVPRASSWIKCFLTCILVGPNDLQSRRVIGNLEVGRWARAKSYDTSRGFSRRKELFDLVGKVRDREVL